MVALGYVVLCLSWSTTWEAIRWCLKGYPTMLGAALRFLLATALLGGMLALQRRSLRESARADGRSGRLGPLALGRRQHLALAAAGTVNGLGYACIYLAEHQLSGGTTAVICASSPLFTVLLARAMRLEWLMPRRVLGLALGFAGVAVLFSDGKELGAGHFRAMLLVGCAAALLWPLYGALLKRHAQSLPPLLSTGYFLFYTSLALLLVSLLRGESLPDLRSVPWQAHASLLYLALVGSVLAWTIYLWLLQRMDLSVLSALGLIQPVLALLIDLLSNQAQLQPRGYLGTMLVLGGMALSALASPRTSAVPSAPRE